MIVNQNVNFRKKHAPKSCHFEWLFFSFSIHKQNRKLPEFFVQNKQKSANKKYTSTFWIWQKTSSHISFIHCCRRLRRRRRCCYWRRRRHRNMRCWCRSSDPIISILWVHNSVFFSRSLISLVYNKYRLELAFWKASENESILENVVLNCIMCERMKMKFSHA